jgi:hypothetical protein
MKDFIIPDRDFGTPAAKSKQMVTLTIDGFDVTVPEGTSIMRAAAEAGFRSRSCARPTVLRPSGPAGCVWWRSRGGTARLRPAPLRLRPA